MPNLFNKERSKSFNHDNLSILLVDLLTRLVYSQCQCDVSVLKKSYRVQANVKLKATNIFLLEMYLYLQRVYYDIRFEIFTKQYKIFTIQ